MPADITVYHTPESFEAFGLFGTNELDLSSTPVVTTAPMPVNFSGADVVVVPTTTFTEFTEFIAQNNPIIFVGDDYAIVESSSHWVMQVSENIDLSSAYQHDHNIVFNSHTVSTRMTFGEALTEFGDAYTPPTASFFDAPDFFQSFNPVLAYDDALDGGDLNLNLSVAFTTDHNIIFSGAAVNSAQGIEFLELGTSHIVSNVQVFYTSEDFLLIPSSSILVSGYEWDINLTGVYTPHNGVGLVTNFGEAGSSFTLFGDFVADDSDLTVYPLSVVWEYSYFDGDVNVSPLTEVTIGSSPTQDIPAASLDTYLSDTQRYVSNDPQVLYSVSYSADAATLFGSHVIGLYTRYVTNVGGMRTSATSDVRVWGDTIQLVSDTAETLFGSAVAYTPHTVTASFTSFESEYISSSYTAYNVVRVVINVGGTLFSEGPNGPRTALIDRTVTQHRTYSSLEEFGTPAALSQHQTVYPLSGEYTAISRTFYTPSVVTTPQDTFVPAGMDTTLFGTAWGSNFNRTIPFVFDIPYVGRPVEEYFGAITVYRSYTQTSRQDGVIESVQYGLPRIGPMPANPYNYYGTDFTSFGAMTIRPDRKASVFSDDYFVTGPQSNADLWVRYVRATGIDQGDFDNTGVVINQNRYLIGFSAGDTYYDGSIGEARLVHRSIRFNSFDDTTGFGSGVAFNRNSSVTAIAADFALLPDSPYITVSLYDRVVYPVTSDFFLAMGETEPTEPDVLPDDDTPPRNYFTGFDTFTYGEASLGTSTGLPDTSTFTDFGSPDVSNQHQTVRGYSFAPFFEYSSFTAYGAFPQTVSNWTIPMNTFESGGAFSVSPHHVYMRQDDIPEGYVENNGGPAWHPVDSGNFTEYGVSDSYMPAFGYHRLLGYTQSANFEGYGPDFFTGNEADHLADNFHRILPIDGFSKLRFGPYRVLGASTRSYTAGAVGDTVLFGTTTVWNVDIPYSGDPDWQNVSLVFTLFGEPLRYTDPLQLYGLSNGDSFLMPEDNDGVELNGPWVSRSPRYIPDPYSDDSPVEQPGAMDCVLFGEDGFYENFIRYRYFQGMNTFISPESPGQDSIQWLHIHRTVVRNEDPTPAAPQDTGTVGGTPAIDETPHVDTECCDC